MKYLEIIFDIFYLSYAIITGIKILKRKNNNLNNKIGIAILILAIGDAFHLIPRILSYLLSYDMTKYLGIGKLITSITMTIFYIYLYEIYYKNYKEKKDKWISYWIWELLIIRIILCLNPENRWKENIDILKWGILRNIPLIILGIIIGFMYYKKRNNDKTFNKIWLYILISFICYIPVVLFSYKYKIIGMLMIPKTICYMLIINSMNKKSLYNSK